MNKSATNRAVRTADPSSNSSHVMGEAARQASLDPRLRTLMKLVEHYDRVNALYARTVFRVNGRVVCVIAHNGQTLFETADDFRNAGGLRPSDLAGDLGLSGETYMEFISREIAYNLKLRYAHAVEIATYDETQAPKLGEIRDEAFGITRERLWAIAAGAAMGFESEEFRQSILVLPRN